MYQDMLAPVHWKEILASTVGTILDAIAFRVGVCPASSGVYCW